MSTWSHWLQSRPLELLVPQPQPGVEAVREEIMALLDDCHGADCERLRWRLNTAESPQDLWLLRGAVFQLLASQHCQALAAERINALVPTFQKVLPSQHVTRV